MTQCPRCSSEWQAGAERCECGYDANTVHALEDTRAHWIAKRKLGRGVAFAGVVLANLARVVGMETLGLVPALISIGAVFYIGWTVVQRRRVDRQLHEARSPSALPEARLV